MTIRRLMSLIAMAFLWTGSQIPVYLFGGVPPYIYSDIGGTDRWIWFVSLRAWNELSEVTAYSAIGSGQPFGPCSRVPIRWVAL